MKLVTEVQPVFVYQHQEAFDSSIIRVEEYLHQSWELGSSIPAVRTVDEYVLLQLQDLFHNAIYRSQNGRYKLEITSILYLRTINLHRLEHRGVQHDFWHLVVGGRHLVDVVNIAEGDGAIWIPALILKATTLHPIGLSINFWSSIINLELLIFEFIDCRFDLGPLESPDFSQKQLVFLVAGHKSSSWLRTPPNLAPSLVVVVGESRQPLLRPKLAACL